MDSSTVICSMSLFVILGVSGLIFTFILFLMKNTVSKFVVVVALFFFYVNGKHLRSCRDGQLTEPHFSWAGLDLLSG